MYWANGAIGVARGDAPLDAVARLGQDVPELPHARAGAADLEAALGRLRELCAEAGYPLAVSLERNTHPPTALGTTVGAALYPSTMAAGALVGAAAVTLLKSEVAGNPPQ